MKVGILTFPGSQSYGASLQMMGTYMTIQDLGCQVEVINYVNDYMRNRKHISESGSFIRQKLRRIKFIPKIWRFRKFEKKIVLYPHKAIHNSMQLREICKRYDYVICGSDQVWNPLITGSDYSYFFEISVIISHIALLFFSIRIEPNIDLYSNFRYYLRLHD